MNLYRIYVCSDDFGGWHTALYYDKNSANDYFKDMTKKYPKDVIITEILDDETGDVLERKIFNERYAYGLTVNDVKSMRQEYISLIKYDLAWKTETVICESISPDDAGEYMRSAVHEDGFGTEWIYITRHSPFVEHIESFLEFPKSITMKV